MFHVYPILMPWADASRRAYAALAGFVDRALAEPPAGPEPAPPGP